MAISGKMANIWGQQKSDIREVEEATSQYLDETSSLDKLFGIGKMGLKAFLPSYLDPLVDPLAEEFKDWANLRPSKEGIEQSEGIWSYGLPEDIIKGITAGEKETKKSLWEDTFSKYLGDLKSSGLGLDLGFGDTGEESNIFNQLFPGGLGRDQSTYAGDISPEFLSQFGGESYDTSNPRNLQEGGRVPKYENGGRAPKKEDIEGFKALYDLFSKGKPTVKSGKPMFTEEGGYSKDYFAEELGLNPEEMSIDTLSYQDPRNYEFEITGDGRKIDLSQKGNIWPRRSAYDKKEREMRSKLRENIGDKNYMNIMNELGQEEYDVLLKKIEDKYFDMDRFEQMDYDMKNFKQGGQVPSDSLPTISDYFARQNKTLGGSSIKSMGGK